MADQSPIEWTDATWNPARGCTKVSPGCARCYIVRTAPFRMTGRTFDAHGSTGVELFPDRLEQPLNWRDPRRIFVNSLSDLFHEAIPDAYVDRVVDVMARAPWHTFQVLTKRAARMQDYLQARMTWGLGHGLRHVWWGVSVENRLWRSRIDTLRATPAAHRFVSFEPLLEDVTADGLLNLDGIEWAIIGFESGKDARAGDIAWIERWLAECRRQGVVPFVKQVGQAPIWHGRPIRTGRRGIARAGSHGGDPSTWPLSIRVREFPPSVDAFRAE